MTVPDATLRPGEWVWVARAMAVVTGTPCAVELPGGTALVLARVGSEICALADVCSHHDFPLSSGEILPDGTIECPWHGARFDCRSGAVVKGPATEPVRSFETRVENGDVWVRS